MDGSTVDAGLFVMRLALGLMLITHGVNKVFGPGGIEGTARWFDGLGLHPGRLHAWLATLTELGSGFLMCCGLIFPVPSVGFVGLMVVAALTDHRGKGFFVFKGGWEYVALVAAVAAALGITGPGRWSLDHLVGLDFRGIGWGLAAFLAGTVAGVSMLLSVRRAAAAKPS